MSIVPDFFCPLCEPQPQNLYLCKNAICRTNNNKIGLNRGKWIGIFGGGFCGSNIEKKERIKNYYDRMSYFDTELLVLISLFMDGFYHDLLSKNQIIKALPKDAKFQWAKLLDTHEQLDPKEYHRRLAYNLSLYREPIKEGLTVHYCHPLAVVATRGVINAYVAKTILLLLGSPLRDPTVVLTLFESVLYSPVVSEEVARRVWTAEELIVDAACSFKFDK